MPKPNDAPGTVTATVFELANNLISASLDAYK
jgi:hypothetical protein